jgi:DNA polymerase I-like protein with 3'-5' exonuclease and polymerase domains
LGHRWAEFDWLAKCFNEDCLKDPARRLDLKLRVFGSPSGRPLQARSGHSVARAGKVELPGTVVPLHELAADHPANDYLRERGFDPAILSRQYDAGYCLDPNEQAFVARNRIIIPIHMHGQLVGWQARFVGDRNWSECPVPKYWTMPGMKKQSILYGFDQAFEYPFVIVVEGIPDVWRIGPPAVALLGHEMSRTQKELLTKTWRTIVLLLDGDAAAANASHAAALKASGLEVVQVALPGDRDPGDMNQEVLIALIRQAAHDQGVELSRPEGGARCGTVVPVILPTAEQRILAHLLDENDPVLAARPVEELLQRVAGEGLDRVYREIEAPATPAICSMQQNGIVLEVEVAEEACCIFAERMAQLQPEINALAGRALDVNNDRELAAFLYMECGLQPLQYTEAGSPSVDTGALEKLQGQHPIVPLVQRQRARHRWAAFVRNMLTHVDRTSGRVFGTWNQVGTVTGRITCCNPALQATPKELRDLFAAPQGKLLIEADYSQFELCILAHFSRETALVQAFSGGERVFDLHRQTASVVTGIPERDVTPQQRRDIGKRFNFAVIYGQTPVGLAKELGVSIAQAQEFLEAYFRSYRMVREWVDFTKDCAQRDGYITTLYGRRRRLPDVGSPDPATQAYALRQAVNAVIQGTAADIAKMAIARLYGELASDCRLLLTNHDSVLLEIPENKAASVAEQVKIIMETRPRGFTVPLHIEVGIGTTWGSCAKG